MAKIVVILAALCILVLPYNALRVEESLTAATPAPAPAAEEAAGSEAVERMAEFFECWSRFDYDAGVEVCAPSWREKTEEPKTRLFSLIGSRKPRSFTVMNILGPAADGSLTVITHAELARYDGKTVALYRLEVRMLREDGEWYVDPECLWNQEKQEEAAPDPEMTAAPDADSGNP